MIRKRAERLTDICCERKWIEEERRDWCIYTFEKWLSILLFFSVVMLWMLASGLYIETVSFLAPFYLLRRRIGGCHARTQKQCFLISLAMVMLVSAFLGKWLLALPLGVLIVLNAVIVMLAFAMYPAYPPQVNFTAAEKRANNRRKNILLLVIFLIQIFSAVLSSNRILAYSICGLALTVVTVVIQKIILLKGEMQNEET